MVEDEALPHAEERENTDESLRAERETADRAVSEKLAAIDDTADAVIARARARADDVVATARARTDREAARSPSNRPPAVIAQERSLEDAALEKERAEADEVLRKERAEHLAVLSMERSETDKDLSSERAHSDDALATRDEFLGIVSHDLRNMLSSMVGYAALIEDEANQPSTQNQNSVVVHARRIRRAGARMDRLIGDLVDVASIEAGMLAVTREVGDPTSAVAEAVETFQAQAGASGVSLMSDLVTPCPVVALDAARILQVLVNLLSNAIKFTPSGGHIIVRVEAVDEDVRISVSDTGVGIAADKLEAVFDRYLQVGSNDRRGVGLGLYISSSIVRGHGGRIWVESTPGKGSTFTFTLPIHTAARPSARPAT